jgi:hypothetical protein
MRTTELNNGHLNACLPVNQKMMLGISDKVPYKQTLQKAFHLDRHSKLLSSLAPQYKYSHFQNLLSYCD